ncbi:thymidine kinase [Candidatus Saccharibacteria bacterium]|nr:thymidine kinase [Candidatus Saccharibacteria bacterium]
MAKLHYKYGAMNSGKSDTLIKTAYNYEERGLKIAVIKPQIDTKGDDMVVARGGHSRNADVVASKDLNLQQEIAKTYPDVSCVLVDEAQFLTRQQISQLFHVAKKMNISVICYGLRADFRAELFPGSTRLFEIADNIEKLPTMCFCGSQAEFNTRKINNAYVFEGDQVAIENGDDVVYDSLCGNCYMREGGVI